MRLHLYLFSHSLQINLYIIEIYISYQIYDQYGTNACPSCHYTIQVLQYFWFIAYLVIFLLWIIVYWLLIFVNHFIFICEYLFCLLTVQHKSTQPPLRKNLQKAGKEITTQRTITYQSGSSRRENGTDSPRSKQTALWQNGPPARMWSDGFLTMRIGFTWTGTVPLTRTTVQRAHRAPQKSWSRSTKDSVYSSGDEPDFTCLKVIWMLGLSF